MFDIKKFLTEDRIPLREASPDQIIAARVGAAKLSITQAIRAIDQAETASKGMHAYSNVVIDLSDIRDDLRDILKRLEAAL